MASKKSRKSSSKNKKRYNSYSLAHKYFMISKQSVIDRILALKTNLEAACNIHDCKLFRSIQDQMVKQMDAGKPLERVVFDTSDGLHEELSNAISCMVGYPDIHSLCFWDCIFTNQAFGCLSSLIISNCSHIWKGCKPAHIDLTSIKSKDNVEKDNKQISQNSGCNNDTLGEEDGNDYNIEGLEIFSRALSSRGCCITILVMDYVQLGNKGFEILCNGLLRCGSIKSISFGYCGIGVEGISTFTKLISKIYSNTEYLHFNVAPLSRHPDLESISLHGNPFGAPGLNMISKVLINFSSLTNLNFSRINIKKEDILLLNDFIGSLSALQAITYIDFDFNYLDKERIMLVSRLLKEKQNIKLFKVTHRLKLDEHREICELMEKNLKKKKGSKKKRK